MVESLAAIFELSRADAAGLSAFSLFVVLFFGTFISEDATCVVAGTLAANGEISFALAVSACFAGILVGDILLYWIGRTAGTSVMGRRVTTRFVSQRSLTRASRWLEQKGASAVFLSRFITGLRLPTYLGAGFLRTDFTKFALYFILAAAIWTPILVGTAAFSGSFAGSNVVIGIVAAFVILKVVKSVATWRDRRILIGKLRRFRNWEFWPLSVFYIPVVLYILLLGFKHRNFTVFTCANPGIPAGGFAGESKDDIYSLLSKAEENRSFLLPHRMLPSGSSVTDTLDAVAKFMDDNSLSFPVVLKPNAGERGKGVRIVKTFDELEQFVVEIGEDYLVQEYAPGEEAGIFYFRYPGAAAGSIFSITRKVFPTVTGDGVSTIEKLILSDDRAVCLAEKYFEPNLENPDLVPDRGQSVRLIEIGTHSRGAIFLDGNDLRTPEVERSIDAISVRTPGFYFGRLDIRFSSIDDLRKGNFKIIELNGVTSESTNIYDPRYSLADAYRILFKQWAIAFEIGAANRLRGASRTSVVDLLRAGLLGEQHSG